MRFLLSIGFLLLCVWCPLIHCSSVHPSEATAADSATLDFETWLRLHDKSYESEDERLQRHRVWLSNQRLVNRHNDAYYSGFTSYTMTMASPFADLTADEFASRYLMDPQHCSATTHPSSGRLRPRLSSRIRRNVGMDDNFISVDWRTKGILTPVKNQGHCGSCWTFSTTGCLEAHTCLAAGKRKKKRATANGDNIDTLDCTRWEGLSEQQLVDCAGDFDNHGCNGGLPSHAFEYVKYNEGLDLESSYQYVANETNGICKANASSVGAHVAAVYNITSHDEEDLVHAIATLGPVSIAYQVSADFRLYQHGVYDAFNSTTNTTMCNNTNTDVNHAVVAVGLGTTAPTTKAIGKVPYYIVRNSWGTSWGMEGHFWMKRGENLCGVSDCASFPLVPVREGDDDDESVKEEDVWMEEQ